ncbi:2-oxo-4-hydroxy-4-carboxy-5-ureidoimidazoline decarboxylase [Longimicrobium sp.]|uniref:2-oxo-4-hydroxy-4-carboxy-5-ureidoimidazoline decarboxylase n=1 Tax=Longimicrobium sp. TaxID=2029185 RepID=UPI002B611D40|nr:2-oxo-4-hydroxy-4-carboxy-5-ureidoimidazoline decarboxylase [Longimicrobium sp.]HSU15361.1 2-oxo-4-hydroxy-4-carboxy-5-ureidoimidazoline decarboxylase [Longimicrobium sp.]
MTLAELNALPEDEAAAALLGCCGSPRWAREMAMRRPFADLGAVLGAADEAWWALEAADWDDAFAAHPRIGERKAAPAQGAQAAAWSAQEQSAAAAAGDDVATALAEGNRAYEQRFGRIYIVCATGKTAGEMLAILRSRLGNDADAELRVAAGEQAKITRLRLEKLLAG